MAKESVLDEDVMARIPKEYRELVRAIKDASMWSHVCADETGIVVIPTTMWFMKQEWKEQFSNNPKLEALGMKFVKLDKKSGVGNSSFN